MHIAFQIIADGTDVTARFQDRLVQLTITDEAGHKSDTAEIVIDDRDYLVALPETGAKLEIALGFTGELVTIGTYVVDDLSGTVAPDTMTIGAKAADMLGGIRARKTRSWHNVTIRDIVGKIAGEHGLKPQVSASLATQFYGYLAQTSESDLNLLTRIAKDVDAVAKPAGGALIFVGIDDGKAADGTVLPVFNVDREQIAQSSWKISGRGKYGSVIAEWADLGTATAHKVKAGDKKPVMTLRHRYASQVEARRAARAALNRSARASSKCRVQLGGFRGDLTAGARVNLRGIKPELQGEWLISRVQHRLSDTLTTSFEAERDNGKDRN